MVDDDREPTRPLSPTMRGEPLVLMPQIVPPAKGGRSVRRPRFVVSASKKTDIPAFYLPWFARRVEEGFVDVPNSRYRHITYRVSLEPEDVAGIVWWSKNYDVYLRDRFYPVFERFERQYFHFTINSRRPDLAWLEPDVPSEAAAVEQIRRLVARRGDPSWIAWRNDPLAFWTEHGEARSSWDPEFFERMSTALSAEGVRTVFVSVADPYLKFRRRLTEFFPHVTLRDPAPAEIDAVASEMTGIAGRHGMTVWSCAEPFLDGKPGIPHGACIDHRFFGSSRSAASDRSMKGREACGCSLHRDIGDYVSQECGYSCVYCYANPNHKRYQRVVKGGRDGDE